MSQLTPAFRNERIRCIFSQNNGKISYSERAHEKNMYTNAINIYRCAQKGTLRIENK